MIDSLLLVEARTDVTEALRSTSLGNAKQLVFGRFGNGTVLHVAATSPEALREAVLDFARVSGVTSVVVLAVRRPE